MEAQMETNRLTEEVWQAIVSNDSSYDNTFIYAIQTTGIFCKPSCKSRIPKKENVLIFQNAEEALSANFRPCKRCKPTHTRLPDQEWADQIKDCIRTHYRESLRLKTIADKCHGSPYHLHRTFKRMTGVTPMEYLQRLRMDQAMHALLHTDQNIGQIAANVGITNTAYFITQFRKVTGLTPKSYRLMNSKREGGE